MHPLIGFLLGRARGRRGDWCILFGSNRGFCVVATGLPTKRAALKELKRIRRLFLAPGTNLNVALSKATRDLMQAAGIPSL